MKANGPHPYHVFEYLQALRNRTPNMDPDQLAQLKQHIAINAPDPRAAALFADINGDNWANLYPPQHIEANPMSTDSAIDTFLNTYGNCTERETDLLERLIFNPATPDYMASIAAGVPTEAPTDPADPQASLIDAFLSAHPDPAPGNADFQVCDAPGAQTSKSAPSDTAAQPRTGKADFQICATQPPQTQPPHTEAAAPRRAPISQGNSLKESLAKIYIKQGKYQKAHEIITELNAAHPNPNFAHQLRYLQKLITITAARQSPTP